VLGKKVERWPPHLVTRGTSGAGRTNGASQTTDAIFARSTISTFGTSISLKAEEGLSLAARGREAIKSILPKCLCLLCPDLCQRLKIFQGKDVCVGIPGPPPPRPVSGYHGSLWEEGTAGRGFISQEAREEGRIKDRDPRDGRERDAEGSEAEMGSTQGPGEGEFDLLCHP